MTNRSLGIINKPVPFIMGDDENALDPTRYVENDCVCVSGTRWAERRNSPRRHGHVRRHRTRGHSLGPSRKAVNLTPRKGDSQLEMCGAPAQWARGAALQEQRDPRPRPRPSPSDGNAHVERGRERAREGASPPSTLQGWLRRRRAPEPRVGCVRRGGPGVGRRRRLSLLRAGDCARDPGRRGPD